MQEKKYYDLTLAQGVMYYALRYSPKKNITNIGSSIWFDTEVDVSLFEKAIYKSVERIDALRLRLTKVDKVIKQYVSDEKPSKIRVEDFSNISVKEVEEKFDAWTAEAMKWKDCELYEFVICKLNDSKAALYMKVNHVIMDAWGLTVFAKDVIEVYSALRENNDLPNPPEPFIPIIEEDLAYNGSERMKKDFEFWKEEFKEKPNYASITPKNVGKYCRTLTLKFKSQPKIYTLEKDRVDKIKEFCKERRLSPQSVFLLGVHCYFAILNNCDEVFINNVLARRSTMAHKKAAGMMINILEFKIKCPSSLTFEEALDKITTDQFRLFRHGDFPYQQIVDYIWNMYRKSRFSMGQFTDMSFTYQLGKIDSDVNIDYSVKYHSNTSSGIPVYLTIMDIADKGTLDFIFEYKVSDVDEETVDKLYSQMIQAIEIGIESPNSTLKDIMDKVKG